MGVVSRIRRVQELYEVTALTRGGHRVGVSLSQDRRIRQAVEPAIGRSWHRYRSQGDAILRGTHRIHHARYHRLKGQVVAREVHRVVARAAVVRQLGVAQEAVRSTCIGVDRTHHHRVIIQRSQGTRVGGCQRGDIRIGVCHLHFSAHRGDRIQTEVLEGHVDRYGRVATTP